MTAQAMGMLPPASSGSTPRRLFVQTTLPHEAGVASGMDAPAALPA